MIFPYLFTKSYISEIWQRVTLFFFGLLCCIVTTMPVLAKDCSNDYIKDQPPSLNYSGAKMTTLCMNGFSVGYSQTHRTPIWSAEYLTTRRLKSAEKLERRNSFHIEKRLPKQYRVSSKNINVKGFDRGHLAPSRDMGSKSSQYDSFSLANIVLQNPKHNRHYWSQIERLTRHQVDSYGEAYVVTGIIFNDDSARSKTGIIVPDYLFKAIYIPELQKAGAYVSKNSDDDQTEVISLAELEKFAGIDVMPSLPDDIKTKALALPNKSDNPDIPEVEGETQAPTGSNNNTSFWNVVLKFFVELLAILLKSL